MSEAKSKLPLPGQKVQLYSPRSQSGRIEGFEYGGNLCIPGKDGAVLITREAAKEFFGLVEPLQEGCA